MYILPETYLIPSLSVFNRTNVKFAFSLISLANRQLTEIAEEDNIDSKTLFAFLKLEPHLASTLFFSVEVISPSNLAVLNSAVVKQTRVKLAIMRKFAREKSSDDVDPNTDIYALESRSELFRRLDPSHGEKPASNSVGTFITKKNKVHCLFEMTIIYMQSCLILSNVWCNIVANGSC